MQLEILDLLRVCVCVRLWIVHFFAVRGLCISAQYFAQWCQYLEYFLVLAGSTLGYLVW